MSNSILSDCCFLTVPKKGFRLIWEITQYCPYSCEYCFTWSSPKRKKFEVDINRVIEKLPIFINTMPIGDILITGGEPLSIIDDIIPILSYLRNSRIPFSFSSNIYDKDLFLKLCKYNPRVINISIDPPSDIPDRSSFKSGYEDINKKLIMAEEFGVQIKITSVINKKNFKGIKILLEFLTDMIAEFKNIQKIAFNREYPIGFAADSKPQTKGELNSTYKIIKKWSKDLRIPVAIVNWSEFHYPLTNCPGGKHLLSLMPNADITPCSLLYNISRSFRIANLLKDSFREINERLDIFASEIDKLRKKVETNTKKCQSCELFDECGSGCPAMLPIAKNHIPKRTCALSPRRIFDHERVILSKLHRSYHSVYSPNSRYFKAPEEELSSSTEGRIKAHTKHKMAASDLAHTIEHVECVVSLAKYIAEKENASKKIVIPAAYFHDIAPREAAMHYMHTFKSGLLAKEFLQEFEEFDEKELDHIMYCIYTSSYGSYLLGYKPLSIEAKVVRDADWLDAIGARGIARVFAFGQAHGAKSLGYPEFDPEGFPVPIDMNITGPDKTPIYHFFTKLLRIYSILETKTARELGKPRHKLMVNFLKQYAQEVGKESFKNSHSLINYESNLIEINNEK